MTPRKMRIAICVTNFKNDLREAISKNAVNLCVGISRNSDTVLLVPGGVDASTKIPSGLSLDSFGKRREYNSKIRVIWNIIALGRYLRRKSTDYDLVHFHVGNLIEMFLIWLFVPRIDAVRVVTVWQPYLELSELISLPKMFRDQPKSIAHHCLANTCFHIPLFWIGNRYFDKIAVSSNYQESQLKFVPKQKVIVIPNGVPSPNRVKSTFSDGRNKLLYIGHATAVKGIDTLLKALQRIRGELNINTTMALTDFDNLDVREMIDGYGFGKEITLKGTVDVYEEMIGHDLFVLPLKVSVGTSHYPNILLECLATGLPIVATSLEFVQEVVTDGKTGVLVHANNPDALGKAIINALSHKDMLSEMSRLQKEEFEKKYTLEKFVERYIQLYESLLEKQETDPLVQR